MTWHHKAAAIIADECKAAYEAANVVKGRKRKRHVPYHVPAIAAALVAALNTDDEHEAKRLFIVHSTGAISLI